MYLLFKHTRHFINTNIFILSALFVVCLLSLGQIHKQQINNSRAANNYPVPNNAIVIAPNGNDANAGLQNAPLKTLSKALSVVPDGGTIVFRAGVYRDGTTSKISKNITVQSYPNETVWLDGTDVLSSWKDAGNGTWYLDGWSTPSFCNGEYYSYVYNGQRADNSGPCNHSDMALDPANPMAGSPQMVFIDGSPLHEEASLSTVNGQKFYYDKSSKRLTIGVNPTGHLVEATARPVALEFQSGTGATVRGIGFRRYGSNEYNGNTTHGAILVNEANVILENNIFTQNAGAGVSYANAQGGIIRGNIFLQNGFNGLDGNGHHSNGVIDNTTIEDNTFDGNNTEHFGINCTISCAQAGAKFAHMNGFSLRNNIFKNNNGQGFWCDLYCTNGKMISNIFHNNTSAGLYYEVSNNGIIASNLLYSNQKYGLKIGSANTRIYNNTIVNNTTNVLIYDDSRFPSGSEVGPDTTNIEFVNNILSGGTNVMQNWKGQNGAEKFFSVFQSNAFYRPNAIPATIIEWQASTGTTFFKSLADFSLSTGLGLQSSDITSLRDPFFINASGLDFHVQSSSSAYGASQQLPSDIAALFGITPQQKFSLGVIDWPGSNTITPTISLLPSVTSTGVPSVQPSLSPAATETPIVTVTPTISPTDIVPTYYCAGSGNCVPSVSPTPYTYVSPEPTLTPTDQISVIPSQIEPSTIPHPVGPPSQNFLVFIFQLLFELLRLLLGLR